MDATSSWALRCLEAAFRPFLLPLFTWRFPIVWTQRKAASAPQCPAIWRATQRSPPTWYCNRCLPRMPNQAGALGGRPALLRLHTGKQAGLDPPTGNEEALNKLAIPAYVIKKKLRLKKLWQILEKIIKIYFNGQLQNSFIVVKYKFSKAISFLAYKKRNISTSIPKLKLFSLNGKPILMRWLFQA